MLQYPFAGGRCQGQALGALEQAPLVPASQPPLRDLKMYISWEHQLFMTSEADAVEAKKVRAEKA